MITKKSGVRTIAAIAAVTNVSITCHLNSDPSELIRNQESQGRDAGCGGMVRTQATSILIATPQRTAYKRLVDPTPMMPPAMGCVVLTGMPTCGAKRRAAADEASAAKPAFDETQ